MRGKKLFTKSLWLFAFLALMFAVPGYAAEFGLEAAYHLNYEYYGQQGREGFFGPYDVDRSTLTFTPGGPATNTLAPGSYSSVNSWVGWQVGRATNSFAAGSDAAKHYQNLELVPTVRVNPAVRFRGKYRLGTYGDPNNSDYLTNSRPGTNVTTSDGQWTLWWIVASTPCGDFVVGKRPEAFGLGLQNGLNNSTTEGVGWIVNYGPFRFSLMTRPQWNLQPDPTLNARNYYNALDKNGLRQLLIRYFTTYREGPLDSGIFYVINRWHCGAESQNTTALRGAYNSYDLVMQMGCVYIKYFDGRFFFNSELACFDERATVNKTGALAGPPASVVTGPRYREAWRFVAEAGVLTGPSKLSLLYAFMPGPDRRAGALINKQPNINAPGNGSYDVFQPYSFLMGYAYGSGVNAFNLNQWGYINEAWVGAARFDYAVAANLNVFGTFLYAERTSHGYPWGYLRPNQTATVTRVVPAAAPGAAVDSVTWTPTLTYRQHPGAPNIPDTALGWEAGVGFDWRLLENYKLSALVAYWRPGRWFNYACIDRAVLGWDDQTDGTPYYPYGVWPDRKIDPLVGVSVNLTVDF
jgi:hypothetical protein